MLLVMDQHCATDGCARPIHNKSKGLCRSCYVGQWQKAKRAARRAPTVCGYCGAEFTPARYSASDRTRYCSRSCKEKAHNRKPETKAKALARYYRDRYGLTPEQVEEMRLAGCAICGRTEAPGRWAGNMHIDHCHETGKVRGVLCHSCNVSLGHFQHDPALLQRAIDYLGAAMA